MIFNLKVRAINVDRYFIAENLRPIEASTPQWSEARTKRGVLRKAGPPLSEKLLMAFTSLIHILLIPLNYLPKFTNINQT